MGAWRAAALASQFGVAVVGSLVGGVVVGQLFDRRLGTAPACFLAGLLLGLVASLYLIYTIYRVQVQPGRGALRPTVRPAGGAGRPSGQSEGASPSARGSAADHAGRPRGDLDEAGETRDIG